MVNGTAMEAQINRYLFQVSETLHFHRVCSCYQVEEIFIKAMDLYGKNASRKDIIEYTGYLIFKKCSPENTDYSHNIQNNLEKIIDMIFDFMIIKGRVTTFTINNKDGFFDEYICEYPTLRSDYGR